MEVFSKDMDIISVSFLTGFASSVTKKHLVTERLATGVSNQPGPGTILWEGTFNTLRWAPKARLKGSINIYPLVMTNIAMENPL